MFAVTTLFLTACLAITGSASPTQKRQALARVINSCTTPNTVALTFDDGPWIYNTKVVDTLNANNVTGTFFFNGNNYDCIYGTDAVNRVKYAYSHGHQIGSHTWAHLDLSTLTWDQIHDEMWRVEQALTLIIGVVPAFMRPPFGSYNDLVRQASAVRGQELVIWDFDSGDSVGATPAESEQSYDQIIAKHPSTLLALNHETEETTADQVLPYAIQKLKAAGYRLVSVAECVGQTPYQRIVAPSPRTANWQCDTHF